MNNPEFIVVHCTATTPDWMSKGSAYDKQDEIDKWHKARGWKGFGYHWMVDRDGVLVAGRKEAESAAAATGYNSNAIHIALVGGFGSNEHDDFFDHFTEAQFDTLMRLIEEIMKDHGVSVKKVIGHNQIAQKACPGFNVPSFMKEYYGKYNLDQKVRQEGVSPSNGPVPNGIGVVLGWLGKLFRR